MKRLIWRKIIFPALTFVFVVSLLVILRPSFRENSIKDPVKNSDVPPENLKLILVVY